MRERWRDRGGIRSPVYFICSHSSVPTLHFSGSPFLQVFPLFQLMFPTAFTLGQEKRTDPETKEEDLATL